MKFSVLLPTRNRLDYLRYAVQSVRCQNYQNWEIIVSDNASEEDIAGFVTSLGDPRIKYVRTSKFVPVTENWNYALDQSNGDWVIMLGDDDGLMPGYFERICDVLTRCPDPDFIYTSALFFAYPDVMPDQPQGFLRRDHNGRFSVGDPYWLKRDDAQGIAQGYLDFRMPVASNMQFSVISRATIDQFRSKTGAFFKSPYPDFYATPALFLTSDRVLILPEPLVIIGITPKSYGYFHFNNQAGHGLGFLNNAASLDADDRLARFRLPGTSYNDSWLASNLAFHEVWAAERGLRFEPSRYRWRQIIHGYKHYYFDRSLPSGSLSDLHARMSLKEQLVAKGLAFGFTIMRALPKGFRSNLIQRLRALIGQHAISERNVSQHRFQNLMEVYDAAENGRLSDKTL